MPILFTARIVALATLPLVIAALVWIAIAVVSWHPATDLLARLFGDSPGDESMVARIAAQAVVVLLFAALAVATALTAIAVLAMPVIVRTVAARHFPTLEARRGGTFVGGLANAMAALAWFVPLWIVSLPLLVFPPLYAAAALLLNGWLSQRMFRYDALAEHASREELATIVVASRKRLLGLGLVLSPLSLIPVVNVLVLPIYAGIAFTELCLDELAKLRGLSLGA